MSKPDFSVIDSLIVERIADGRNTFSKIDGGEVYNQAMSIGQMIGREPFRVIDRRLQALRKAGKIKYTTTEKWTVA